MNDEIKNKFMSYKFIDSRGNLRDKIVKREEMVSDTFFDGSSFGFCPTNKSDLILHPFGTHEHYDPIRGMKGVFCFIKNPDGTEFEKDFRTIAHKYMIQDEQTQNALFGAEPEFYICHREGFNGKLLPFGVKDVSELKDIEQYKWYGSLPPIDKTQEIRNKIACNLLEAGFKLESMHNEVGIGQCEYSWACDNLIRTADNIMFFKYIVSATCAELGYEASFEAKPFKDLNGNGEHIHMSIPSMKSNPEHVEAFAQGLVDHYKELLAVCCVGESSSKRLVPGFEAPTEENNGWGWHDRTKTVRIPGAGGRVEYRLPDPEMNPYVALPMMLKFGYEKVLKMK